jgi:serine/threonine-protein kinase
VKKLAFYLVAAGAAFLSGLVLFNLGMLAFVHSGAETKVPDLAGMDVAVARAELEESGFSGVVVREENSNELSEGRILDQRPSAGAVLRSGRKVLLTVSLGVKRSTVPNLVGGSSRQASIVLDRNGFAQGTVTRLHHPSVERGSIVAQDPPFGADAPEGAHVDLLVSLGRAPKSFVMPNLVGRSAREAEDLLRANGVRVGDKTVLIDRSVLPSTVLEQEPPPGGRIDAGAEVDLVVSSRS